MEKLKPDDTIIREGLRIDRFGRNISVDLKPTKEQSRKTKKIISKLKKSLPSEIINKAKNLESELKDYNSFDIISLISYFNLFANPETVKEYSHKGNPFCIEYLTLLCLKDSYNNGKNLMISFNEMLSIQKKLNEIFEDVSFSLIIEGIGPETEESNQVLSKFQYRTKSNELLVRTPAYPHHFETVLKSLFSNIAIKNWLATDLNLNIDEVIDLCNCIAKLMENRIHEKKIRSFEQQKVMHKELIQFRKGIWKSGKCDRKSLVELSKLSKRDAAKNIRQLGVIWSFFAMGDTFSFSANNLSEISGKPIETVKNYLNNFSIEFGSIPTDFYFPEPTHILKLKPIIHYQDKYLCPVPYLLIWSIKPLFEAFLNPDSNLSRNHGGGLWQKYQKIRSKYLENESLNLFGSMLNTEKIHNNLEYLIQDQGQEKRKELDGLIDFDSALLLIECKAGTMTTPALRGAPKRMETDLKKLLVDSHNQTLQAKKFICQTKKPVFYDKQGRELILNKEKIERIFLVTIILDPMTVYTTNLHEVIKLGFFEEGDLPWAVSLLDLFVFNDLIEFPTQLIHYLLRRLAIYDLDIAETFDELDWFGHYLKDGLYFEGIKESGINSILVSTYTTEMDDYYFYITGKRKTPAPKPAQKMPALFNKIIRELESSKPDEYLNIALTLLDLDENGREELCKNISSTKKRSRRDKNIHDCSGFIDGSKAITFMCSRNMNKEELENKLYSYCLSKKNKSNISLWLGLGSTLKNDKLIDVWKVIK